jgi:hypothetical protein
LDREKNEFVLTIRKNGKILVNIDSWWNSSGDITKIGVFPFLGNDNKQLIVMQYSGGSGGFHMCKIYDLVPNIRMIHNDEEYNLSGEIAIVDINRDHKYEIVRAGIPFGMPYLANAYIARSKAILSYDMNMEKYVIENKSFPDYVLENIEYDINRFNNTEIAVNTTKKESIFDEYISAMLEIVVSYIYSGKEKEGWDFYNNRYRFSNKENVRIDILRTLKNDPVYKMIYSKK